MQKIFIIGFLSLAHICTASELESEVGSKTHKVHIMEKTGERVFYPGKYDTYEKFKQEHVTELLLERLEMLCDFKESCSKWSSEETLDRKTRLEKNEVVLVNNITYSELKSIFGENYNNRIIQIHHIVSLANFLKNRFLPEGQEIQESPDIQKNRESLDTLVKKYSGQKDLILGSLLLSKEAISLDYAKSVVEYFLRDQSVIKMLTKDEQVKLKRLFQQCEPWTSERKSKLGDATDHHSPTQVNLKEPERACAQPSPSTPLRSLSYKSPVLEKKPATDVRRNWRNGLPDSDLSSKDSRKPSNPDDTMSHDSRSLSSGIAASCSSISSSNSSAVAISPDATCNDELSNIDEFSGEFSDDELTPHIEELEEDDVSDTQQLPRTSAPSEVQASSGWGLGSMSKYKIRFIGRYSSSFSSSSSLVNPGELGLFYEEEKLYCQISGQDKLKIQIDESAQEVATSQGLRRDIFNKITETVQEKEGQHDLVAVTSIGDAEEKALLQFISLCGYAARNTLVESRISSSIDVLRSSSSHIDESLAVEKKEEIGTMIPISEENIKGSPYSAILSIMCEFRLAGNLMYKSGTGFIDNNFALTAAHVLHHEGQFADNVYCYIKRHGNRCEKKVRVDKYVYANEYERYLKGKQGLEQNLKNTALHLYGVINNYVLLHLDRQTNSTIKLAKLEDCHDLRFWFCGYPGAEYNTIKTTRDHSNLSYPYEIPATIKSFSTNLVTSSTRVYRGMSGGPVSFICDEEERKALGLIVAQKGQTTLCCGFTSDIIERIHQWQKCINEKKEFEVIRYGGVLGLTKYQDQATISENFFKVLSFFQ